MALSVYGCCSRNEARLDACGSIIVGNIIVHGVRSCVPRIVCNILVLAAAGATVVSEGMPSQAGYLILTVAVLVVPLLSGVVLVWGGTAARGRAGIQERPRPLVAAEGAALVANVLTFAACLWVAVSRYPYTEGNSIIPYAALLVATPVVTVVALLRGLRDEAPAPTNTRTA